MLKPGTEVAITDITPLDDYRLRIRFSDGHISDLDFEPFLRDAKHPDIRKYLNHKLFKSYRNEWGNLVWGDYELCFPLECLYESLLTERHLHAAEPPASYGDAD